MASRAIHGQSGLVVIWMFGGQAVMATGTRIGVVYGCRKLGRIDIKRDGFSGVGRRESLVAVAFEAIGVLNNVSGRAGSKSHPKSRSPSEVCIQVSAPSARPWHKRLRLARTGRLRRIGNQRSGQCSSNVPIHP